ncbi:HalD/BesD family halogenase [Streptomyces sp. NPDC054787]
MWSVAFPTEQSQGFQSAVRGSRPPRSFPGRASPGRSDRGGPDQTCGQRRSRWSRPGLPSAGLRDASAVFSLPASSRWESLRRQFTADGYVPLSELISPAGLTELGNEAGRLETDAVRRDFRMPCMGDSPRHMTTLGGDHIARASPLITQAYQDHGVMELLSSLLNETVVAVHDPIERHVLNVLHQPGDTHGAHTDDYPLALVLFLEAPPHATDGGLLEFHPGRADLAALHAPGTRRAHHRPADGYLLRSDLTAHRVTPPRTPGGTAHRPQLRVHHTRPPRRDHHLRLPPLRLSTERDRLTWLLVAIPPSTDGRSGAQSDRGNRYGPAVVTRALAKQAARATGGPPAAVGAYGIRGVARSGREDVSAVGGGTRCGT